MSGLHSLIKPLKRKIMRLSRRNPIAFSKIICGVFIIFFYLCYIQVHPPARTQGKPLPKRRVIQYEQWNKTGKVELARRDSIKGALLWSLKGYKQQAWGRDEVLPVTGAYNNSRNAWGAWIVESAGTLAVMGLHKELGEHLEFVTKKVDFRKPVGLVDTYETTIRYLGALVSIVELGDSGMIPTSLYTAAVRKGLLGQAKVLAENLMMAFDDGTGLPWPKIDFKTWKVSPNGAAISPAIAGTNFLELCTLSKLTGDADYCGKATMAWIRLVRNFYVEELPGLVDGNIDVETGELVGRHRYWDSYYEYLIKASLLLPDSPNAKVYKASWVRAAEAVRHNITSKSAPYQKNAMSHLYMGKWNGPWYINEMSQSAFSAPGNILLGGRVLQREDLVMLGKVLMEGCRHTFTASPTGLGPASFSWHPAPSPRNNTFEAKQARQKTELNNHGFWAADARYQLRPEYIESLFYAYRTTGENRYREWAWEAFEAIEKHCKTAYGYGGIEDVMVESSKPKVLNREETWWVAATLKYLYLIFEDVNVVSLDDWIFSAGGHLLRAR